MQYTKQPLTIKEQISKLKNQGLNFADENLANHYLQNISYYRLKAFMYPFQNKIPNQDHDFLRNDIDFMDIVDLYVFDKHLRSLVFSELEKIEISVRTKISHTYSLSSNNATWYEEEKAYSPQAPFDKILEDIKSEVDRSNEEFIKHYKQKYDDPQLPPSWMVMEVISFGTLSRLYKSLSSKKEKREIAQQFGIGHENVFANWLHAFSNLRNHCAHHSRIWNRRFTIELQLPYNTTKPFIEKGAEKRIHKNKLFALLSAIKYISDTISLENSFKKNLEELLLQPHKLLSTKEMGFPSDWKSLPVWSKHP